MQGYHVVLLASKRSPENPHPFASLNPRFLDGFRRPEQFHTGINYATTPVFDSLSDEEDLRIIYVQPL